jgi:hypothetical protein
MEAGACFKCKKDLHKGKEKYVAVSFGNTTRLFHPDCHACSVCDKALRAGASYTVDFFFFFLFFFFFCFPYFLVKVEPATGLSICEPCWQNQHGSSQTLPSASGGVSWTVKPPAEKGFVWSQVTLLDHADVKEAIKEKTSRQKILGTCAACKQKVYDELIRLEGGKVLLHLNCHQCAACKEKLGTASYYVDKNKTICENCITKKLANLSIDAAPAPSASAPVKQTSLGSCSTCNKNITGKVVSANGKSFCFGCLKCLKCAKVIGGQDAFFNRENGVICEDCGS